MTTRPFLYALLMSCGVAQWQTGVVAGTTSRAAVESLGARRVVAVQPLSAPLQAEFFVSPQGDDAHGDGSAAAPFASMDRARLAIAALGAPLTADVAVSFAPGTYAMALPVVFGPGDSGTGGHTVHYRASPANAPGTSVSLSGGTPFAGPWTAVGPRGASTLWTAPYTGGPSRHLYVDGVRALPAGFIGLNESKTMRWNITGDEVAYFNPGDLTVLEWSAAQPVGPSGASEELEFVYTGIGTSWSEARCRATAVERHGSGGTLITMAQPCFANGRERGGANNPKHRITSPYAVENAFAGLQGRGTGFISRATSQVFFVGDQAAPPVSALVPTIEALVQVVGGTDGKPEHRVSHLSFEGLTFEYTTWLLPSGGDGYIDGQSGVIAVGEPKRTVLTPGAVSVQGADDVTFVGCVFQHLGSTALVINGGSRGCAVVNCSFSDISGGAVWLGDVSAANAPPPKRDGDHLVHNTLVTDTPAEYHGCGAIAAGFVKNVTVSHNFVRHASNGGIELGWGWAGVVNATYSGGSRVLNNRIEDANWLLYDSGSIYLNGWNSGGEVAYNYAVNQSKLHGALYPDEGSTNWVIHDNVCEADAEWLHIWTASIVNITVENNFFGPLNSSVVRGVNCTLRNNIWVRDGAWPPAARAIMAAAGLLD